MDFQRVAIDDAGLPGQISRIRAAGYQEQQQTDHPSYDHQSVRCLAGQDVVARASFIFYDRRRMDHRRRRNEFLSADCSCVEFDMRRSPHAPSIAPRGDDHDVYMVEDDHGRIWPEADSETTDFDTVVADLNGSIQQPASCYRL